VKPFIGLILPGSCTLWGDATETVSALFWCFWEKKGRVFVSIMRPVMTYPKIVEITNTVKNKTNQETKTHQTTHKKNTQKNTTFQTPGK